MSESRALALFEAALDQPVELRAAFLREAAGGDSALLRMAEELLLAHATSAGFLEPAALTPPRVLGPYRLIECLGSGGMGQVWRAERSDGAFEQQVAIKFLASGFSNSESIRRAEAERGFLARLSHPNIARILDGGTTPERQPYVVMEFVDGERIDDWCRSHMLDLAARVRMFLQVLDAVDAAHRALILHRDLKPANVLVARDGAVKLLDFGIAKSLDDAVGDFHTQTGLGPLTPQYASPEQLAGSPLTTACDLYVLGLLLFELATGCRPFESAGMNLAQITERLAASVPPRASTRLDPDRLALPARAAPAWRRLLDGDLDRVLQKALAFEPARRYRSAREFADDLERWLEHRPVLARAGGVGYRVGKFARRHRLAVATASAAVLALALGFGFALREAELKRAEADRAQRSNEFLLDLIARADPFQSGKSPTLLEAVERAEAEIPRRFAGQPELEADVRLAIGHAFYTLNRLDEAERNLGRALALRPEGTAHAVVLTALADVDWSRANYPLAEQRYGEARALLANAGPAALPALVDASSSLGNLLADLERGAEALAIADQNLRLIEPDPALAVQLRGKLLGNRAYALHGLKRLEEAATAYAAARAEMERQLPPVHPDLAINLNNHAMVLRDLGRKAEAAALLERSVAMRREIFGGEHWMLATSLTNLAVLKLETGATDDAQRLITEAISNAEHKVDPKDPILARVYETAARIALAREDRAGAIVHAQQALVVLDRLDPPQPDIRQRAQATLAAAQQATGAH